MTILGMGFYSYKDGFPGTLLRSLSMAISP